MMTTLDDLQDDIQFMHKYNVTPEYYEKQMHRVPSFPVVDRVSYILDHSKNKRVLHLGCSSGYLHSHIAKVSKELTGWDIEPYPGTPIGNFVLLDLDEQINCCGFRGKFDLVVVAEILEHLGNPGNILKNLKNIEAPLLITVPNAFSAVGRYHLSGGVENVHKQHTAWYSWRTLLTLIERYGYEAQDFAWYNCPKGAQPHEAEGLIVLTSGS